MACSPSVSTSGISEDTFNAEIIRIYKVAQPATKSIYDLGQSFTQPALPNWIIRWMLWHSFRYRDGRSNNQTRADETPASVLYDVRNGHGSATGWADERSSSKEGYLDRFSGKVQVKKEILFSIQLTPLQTK